METGFRLTMTLTVDDPAALWTAAAALAMASPGMTMRDVVETLGPLDAPQIDDCLAMLLQPERFAGCAVRSLAVVPAGAGSGAGAEAAGAEAAGGGRTAPSADMRASSCDLRLPPALGPASFRYGYAADPV